LGFLGLSNCDNAAILPPLDTFACTGNGLISTFFVETIHHLQFFDSHSCLSLRLLSPDGPIFSSLHAHPVAQTFLSFVSIAYELAPVNFWDTVYGDWKKVSAPCTITRCALEHFLVGHWLLQAHICIWHIEEGWEWRRFPWLICWCRLRWQGYDILSSALLLFL